MIKFYLMNSFFITTTSIIILLNDQIYIEMKFNALKIRQIIFLLNKNKTNNNMNKLLYSIIKSALNKNK